MIERTNGSDAGAVFSDCLRYRYRLWRKWTDWTAVPGYVLWLLLNPSTADEFELDPTLRRVDGFTRRMGYSHWQVANSFGLRSTDPRGLLTVADPVGQDNDRMLEDLMAGAAVVVVGWGGNKLAAGRVPRILELAHGKPLMCLGTTTDGSPRHPLYLKADTILVPWGQSCRS